MADERKEGQEGPEDFHPVTLNDAVRNAERRRLVSIACNMHYGYDVTEDDWTFVYRLEDSVDDRIRRLYGLATEDFSNVQEIHQPGVWSQLCRDIDKAIKMTDERIAERGAGENST